MDINILKKICIHLEQKNLTIQIIPNRLKVSLKKLHRIFPCLDFPNQTICSWLSFHCRIKNKTWFGGLAQNFYWNVLLSIVMEHVKKYCVKKLFKPMNFDLLTCDERALQEERSFLTLICSRVGCKVLIFGLKMSIKIVSQHYDKYFILYYAFFGTLDFYCYKHCKWFSSFIKTLFSIVTICSYNSYRLLWFLLFVMCLF